MILAGPISISATSIGAISIGTVPIGTIRGGAAERIFPQPSSSKVQRHE